MLVELVRESISDAEQRKAAVEEELVTLREIEELAEKLNGGGTVSEPTAAPMRPRQHDATRAEQRAGAKKKTSTRRPPAPPRQESGTTAGAQAPAGGDGQKSTSKDEILKVLEQRGEASTPAIADATGIERSVVDRSLRRLTEEGRVECLGPRVDGPGRPSNVWRLSAAPSGGDGATAVELVDKIVEVLEVDGGRVSRLDLKTRVGDPEFEEFAFALDRLIAERKIAKVQAGGVSGYELAKGGA